MASRETPGRSDERPANHLLRRLTESDYELIGPYLERGTVSVNRSLSHPGDQIKAMTFPCGATLIGFAVSVELDREVYATTVGAEGVLGSIIRRPLPAYSRAQVLVGGDVARLPARKFEQAARQSPSLRNLMERYAAFLFAQTLQASACNAGHSNEQRMARYILSVRERTGDVVPFTHEQLAGLLGVGRSYTSRLIEGLKADGFLETRRGAILVTDERALREAACGCSDWIKRHFEEIFAAG